MKYYMQETRSIKFYLDKSVNKSKINEIVEFLKECADVENQIYLYLWYNYNIVLDSKNKIDFNEKTKDVLNYKKFTPKLKSHHFQQVSQDVYGNLIGIKNKIINQMKFKCDTKEEYRIVMYCRKFCFEWDRLEKYIKSQISKYKNKDIEYYKFLLLIKKIIDNEGEYCKLKQIIESAFWEQKNRISCPQMKNPTIWCNTAHTISLNQTNYYNWYFILDSNEFLSKRKMKKIIIPIKYSNYHYKVLKDKQLNNTFKIRLDNAGRVEIMASYNIEKDYPSPKKYTSVVGIDIGLKILVTASDGEIVEQNPKILNYLKYVDRHDANRLRLQQHIRNKLKDNKFIISNKRTLKINNKLRNMVNCDNRYKIKQFLRGRELDLIVMEDIHINEVRLSKEVNRLLRRLHIQQIKNDIQKYCKEFGINLVLINPAYTSQQCSLCNYIDKGNRKTQEKFSCLRCGYSANADYNASINIRNRIKFKEIKLSTPNYKIKEIIGLHCITNN